MLLLHPSRTLRTHHAREVEGRDIRLSMSILGKLQLPELAMGGEVSSCPGKALQSLGHYIGTAQQTIGLWPVLQSQQIRAPETTKNTVDLAKPGKVQQVHISLPRAII